MPRPAVRRVSAILADTCLPTGLPTRLLTRGTKGRVVGTLSYAWGEGAKACYPYRMVDYCSLLWFPKNGLVFPFFVLLVSGYILPPSLCGLVSLCFPGVGITVTCFPYFLLDVFPIARRDRHGLFFSSCSFCIDVLALCHCSYSSWDSLALGGWCVFPSLDLTSWLVLLLFFITFSPLHYLLAVSDIIPVGDWLLVALCLYACQM